MSKKLLQNQTFKNALQNKDISWIKEHVSENKKLIELFDKGIEDRARHYTSNLVKLGFTDDKRNISNIGKLLINNQNLYRDNLEKLLPLDNINIIYLRQLLKLKIFDNTKTNFYAPFLLAIFILLKKERIDENNFFYLIQGCTPYIKYNDLDIFFNNNFDNQILSDIEIEIPNDIKENQLLSEETFKKYFKNGKSNSTTQIYYQFYTNFCNFLNKATDETLDSLLSYYENEKNKKVINKAFGLGKNFIKTKNGVRPTPKDFLNENKEFTKKQTNVFLFEQFTKSKQFDMIREYSDTTKRIFKATGIISFENGYVELAYREILQHFFYKDDLKKYIFGNINNVGFNYISYEIGINSYFCEIKTFSEILGYSYENVNTIITKVKKQFPDKTLEELPFIINQERNNEFNTYIKTKYPKSKIIEILSLFENRKNDKQIKEIVSPDASVPTIYEYIVGIAWYYFSGESINILNSFNLSLSANFEPLMHAGGGQGDIVIKEKDKVTMLEVTLMDTNSQKRGEWEPVLRHSINLKVEEDSNENIRTVTTFFIADKFDYNTINIWKAISSVPLQSSYEKEKFTENVVIMPLSTQELSQLLDKSINYNNFISDVHQMFEKTKSQFDISWRKKITDKLGL